MENQMRDRLGPMGLFANQKFSLVLSAWILTAAFFIGSPKLHAGGNSENVLVVVNEDSQSSKLIANHYIALRKVPAINVVYLKDIPNKELIPLDKFINLILRPILVQIEDRGLDQNIDYIVYSADFPTAVNIKQLARQLTETSKKQGRSLNQANFNGVASINALTFFAQHALASEQGGGEELMSLTGNRYYRQESSKVLAQPFVGPLQKEFQRSIDTFSKDKDDPLFLAAIDSLKKMARNNPGQMAVHYWRAKFAAKSGDTATAIRSIKWAKAMGLSDRAKIENDSSFYNISDPDFLSEIREMKNGGSKFAISRGFRQRYQWAPNGMLNQTKGQGQRYFLSTVLAVTRNYGNSEMEALEQIRGSIGADFTKPSGTFYFSDIPNARSKARVRLFRDAVNLLQGLGYRARIVKTALPKSVDDILGLTCGIHEFDFGKSRSSLVPGAICENLTSFGGKLTDIRQTKLSEFLRYGAGGSSGTVVEPMVRLEKFPHPMIHVHYARGCSLAESFYQSISGPFQTLIVGDAICQPFATPVTVTMSGIELNEEIKDDERQLSFDASRSLIPIAGIELYIDGQLKEQYFSLDPINMKMGLLSDGFHEMRVVFVGSNRQETRNRVIVPFEVNITNRNCQLEVETPKVNLKDNVSLSFSSENADTIRLFHNHRVIHEIDGDSGTAEIPATVFGRGPVAIQAIATFSNGLDDGDATPPTLIASVPVSIIIQGEISKTKRITGQAENNE